MNLFIEINFTPYIPTTGIGLLGLVFGYLYFYYKNKNDNKLKELQSVNPEERRKVVEAYLNDLGVSIDTSKLTSQQKYNLLAQSLTVKTRKYLIISITTIVLSVIIYFIIKGADNTTGDTGGKEKTKSIFYKDNDRDGYGDKNNYTMAETQPEGYVTNSEDCCDNDSKVYLEPGNPPVTEKKIWTRSDVLDFYNASQEGNLSLVTNYVNLGMPVDTALRDYNAALPLAVAAGNTEVVKFLLAKGSNPNQRYVAEAAYTGSTPLIQASYSNFVEIVDLLINNKADLNMVKADGDAMTALMFACLQGNAEVVNKLLVAGADANKQRASNRATAKDFANGLSSPKKEEIVSILNNYGAKTAGEL